MADTGGRRALAGFVWPAEQVEEIVLCGTLCGVTDDDSDDLNCGGS